MNATKCRHPTSPQTSEPSFENTFKGIGNFSQNSYKRLAYFHLQFGLLFNHFRHFSVSLHLQTHCHLARTMSSNGFRTVFAPIRINNIANRKDKGRRKLSDDGWALRNLCEK